MIEDDILFYGYSLSILKNNKTIYYYNTDDKTDASETYNNLVDNYKDLTFPENKIIITMTEMSTGNILEQYNNEFNI